MPAKGPAKAKKKIASRIVAVTPRVTPPRKYVGQATRASRAALGVAAILVIVGGLWWVTAGSWRIFVPIAFGNIFDAQAQSFLRGHVDIDCGIASGEAFAVSNKCYIYFGPVPAILRMPVLILFPGAFGYLSRLMVWTSGLLMLFFLMLIVDEAGYAPGSWAWPGFLMLTAFGSTLPYMWGWPTGYVEAILWGTAFAAGAIYALLRWSRVRRGRWLWAACVLGLLAFFSRVTAGVGPLAITGILALRSWWWRGPERRTAAGVLVTLTAAAGLFVTYNYARFGTLLDAVPVRYSVQYTPERLARIGGSLLHPAQAPLILLNYALHTPQFRSSYPWLEFRGKPTVPPRVNDLADYHVGFPASMPALLLLAGAGWWRWRSRRELWILLAALPGLLIVASTVFLAHRYVHEFILLLAPAAAFGLGWAWESLGRRLLVVALGLFSIYAGWAIALVGQREALPWTDEDARERHRITRYTVDRWLGAEGARKMPILFDYRRGDFPPSVEGVEGQFQGIESRYRFQDGEWRHVAGPFMHRFESRLARGFTLPDQPRIPLASGGKGGESDTVLLLRSPAQADLYRVCIEHGGLPTTPCSAELGITPDREYLFVHDFDRLNRRVRVTLDGAVLVSRDVLLHAWTEGSAWP